MMAKPLSQDALSKIYMALWTANREAAEERRLTIMINTAFPAETVWDAMDHETRIATRNELKSMYGTRRWKTINPLFADEWGREH